MIPRKTQILDFNGDFHYINLSENGELFENTNEKLIYLILFAAIIHNFYIHPNIVIFNQTSASK